jgi:hypothetical protein
MLSTNAINDRTGQLFSFKTEHVLGEQVFFETVSGYIVETGSAENSYCLSTVLNSFTKKF